MLTTLAAFKLQLGISGTSQDSQLTAFLTAASGAIEDYCGRKLEAEEVTEYHSGNGFAELVLRRRPVSSIESVHVDASGAWGSGVNAFAASTEYTEGTQFGLVRDDGEVSKSGLLRRLGIGSLAGVGGFPSVYRTGTLSGFGSRQATWPVGEGNIKVVYTAGYETMPQAIQQAAINLGAWMKNNAPSGGLVAQSESLGKYSVTLGQTTQDTARNALAAAGEMGSTRQLLARYREVAL